MGNTPDSRNPVKRKECYHDKPQKKTIKKAKKAGAQRTPVFFSIFSDRQGVEMKSNHLAIESRLESEWKKQADYYPKTGKSVTRFLFKKVS